jgi:hypothetical protein
MPLTRSKWTAEAAASTAPAAAQPRFLRTRRRRPTTRRRGPRCDAWLLPAASSYHEALTVRSWTRPTPFAPRLMPLALMGDSATRPHVSPSPAHLTHLSPSVQGLRPNLWVERRPRRDETPAAHSVPTRRATATWANGRTRPSHVHKKPSGAAAGEKAARGKAARAGAEARAGG